MIVNVGSAESDNNRQAISYSIDSYNNIITILLAMSPKLRIKIKIIKACIQNIVMAKVPKKEYIIDMFNASTIVVPITGSFTMPQTICSFSNFINLMKTKKVDLNRKMLSEIAINDNATFKSIVAFIK